MTELIYILLGIGVGLIGGIAGIGGAPFIIAFLVLVLGVPQFLAQGSVITMMLGPMTLLGVLALRTEVKEQWKNIIIGVIAYGIFSYFGALLAFRIRENSLEKYFAILLIIVAILQFTHAQKQIKEKDSIPHFWMIIIGSAVGIIGGLFGIGAGVLMVPVFIFLFNLKKDYARALSLAILLPPVSLGAFFKYQAEGAID